MPPKNKKDNLIMAINKGEADSNIQKIVEEAKSVEVTPKIYCKVAGCNQLNLRKAPSKSADVIDILNAGTELLVIEEGKEFSKVRNESDKSEGYAMSQYLLLFSKNY